MQCPFCLFSTDPTFALSSTRLQRWHMAWFQPFLRCGCLRYCWKEILMLCLFGYQTLVEQYQRDDNVLTLLEAMHEAFDFANQEDAFKAIWRESRQAQILTLMLQHVCNCCDFIQSYARNPQFCTYSSPISVGRCKHANSGMRTLKNIGSQVNNQIEDFRTTLLELRKAFLDQGIITTEITALQILDDVGIISANSGRISSQLDGMATQLKWVSSQVSDAGT